MSDNIYIFIDESGDTGNNLAPGASSHHYAELALQLNEKALDNVISHIIGWKYILGKSYEAKKLPKAELAWKYLSPIWANYYNGDLSCSCVYLMKANYSGPYLNTTASSNRDPLKFRNFVHRLLLEYHFNQFRPPGNDIELVFDHYDMSLGKRVNMEKYLKGNWRLHNQLGQIRHVNSKYTEPMQLASQLVNGVKDVIIGTANGERNNLMRFVKLKDITNP